MFWNLFRRRRRSEIEEATASPPSIKHLTTIGDTSEMEALSLFDQAADPKHRVSGEWEAVWNRKLDAPFTEVLLSLKEKGLLRDATVAEKFSSFHSLQVLKGFAKEKNLKVGGRKAELAKRIIENSSANDLDTHPDVNALICTDAALDKVQEYRLRKKHAAETAKEKTRECLQTGRFSEACEVVCKFEESQFFPRGMGVDWSTAGADLLWGVEHIFSSNPKFHQKRYGTVSSGMRLGAAMDFLWGTSTQPKEQDSEFSHLTKEQLTLAQRMLVFYVQNLRVLENARNSSIDLVCRISVSDDGRTTCHACLSDADKRYSISEAPELPHADCDCTDGCRCVMLFDGPDLTNLATFERLTGL